MKTNSIVMTLFTIVLVSVGIFSIMNNFNSRKECSDILLQNIEALSDGDDGDYDSSGCSNGFAQYAYVESYMSKSEVVEHLCDGGSGKYGLDRVYVIDFKGCRAAGEGGLQGDNYHYPTSIGNSNIRECVGPQGHRPFVY